MYADDNVFSQTMVDVVTCATSNDTREYKKLYQ